MEFWPAFSDELNKMAIVKDDKSSGDLMGEHVKRINPGPITFKSQKELDAYKEGIRKHLSNPDVAARVQARRKRTELFSDVDNIIRKAQKIKGRRLGVLGNIMKVIGGVTAGGAAGYLLGKKGKKESTNEPARTA